MIWVIWGKTGHLGHFGHPFLRKDGPPEKKCHFESGLDQRDEAATGFIRQTNPDGAEKKTSTGGVPKNTTKNTPKKGTKTPKKTGGNAKEFRRANVRNQTPHVKKKHFPFHSAGNETNNKKHTTKTRWTSSHTTTKLPHNAIAHRVVNILQTRLPALPPTSVLVQGY